MGLATDIIYIVIAALVGGLVAHALRQPLIFGYILAGIIVGPYTGGITVKHIHDIEMLAEVGVALLLFTLGLEFSFGELKRLARITFVAAPLQILLSAVAGYLITLGLGLAHNDAIWIGAAISLSSTMVVLKTLTARDALESNSGRVMLALLIAQDVAIVPLMLLLPQLTTTAVSFGPIIAALVKSAGFLLLMYFAGVYIFPRIFKLITRQGSRELFFISTLVIAFGAGFLSHKFGLSFALGAFVAGMLLSETDFNQQALSDVSTLRDLFALIFFVSVGMLFDPTFFISNIGTILLLALTIVLSKGVITAGLLRLLRYDTPLSWTVGLGVAQVGEFAFVITKAGNSLGHLSSQSFSLIISVTVVSMIATPALFWLGERISRASEKRTKYDAPSIASAPVELSDHVIIIGGGVVGKYVARVLNVFERSYVVVESDYKTVMQMRDLGVNVVFGDASRPTILEAVGLKRASLVVITTTNDKILPLIVSEIKELRPDVPIVVRVEEVEDIDTLSSLKVEEIVQPQLEVGLEMVRQSLLTLGIDESRVFSMLRQLRAERYDPMGHVSQRTAEDIRLMAATRLLDFIWFEVKEGTPLSNLTLGESQLRETYGASVAAILRDSDYISNPKANFQMKAGDILGLIGTKSQLESLSKIRT